MNPKGLTIVGVSFGTAAHLEMAIFVSYEFFSNARHTIYPFIHIKKIRKKVYRFEKVIISL